jgi:hypothetical protein
MNYEVSEQTLSLSSYLQHRYKIEFISMNDGTDTIKTFHNVEIMSRRNVLLFAQPIESCF